MKFIKLTATSDTPIFVRPELVSAFGPIKSGGKHQSWLCLCSSDQDILVVETHEQIAELLGAEIQQS